MSKNITEILMDNVAAAQPRILAVDDNEASRYHLVRLLAREGYDVDSAETGEGALQKAELQPDTIVLDIRLPDISGLEVCRRLKANPQTAHIPVLHLSASCVENEDKARGLDAGADAYLTYPVDSDVLLATVRAMLRIGQMEKRLRAVAHHWQSTFDAITDAVFLTNADGKILRCNKVATSILRQPFYEIIGKALDDVIDYDLGVTHAILIEPSSSASRKSKEVKIDNRWYRVTTDQTSDVDGNITGSVVMISDVTTRVEAQHKLLESQQQIAEVLQGITECYLALDREWRIVDMNPNAETVWGGAREELTGRVIWEAYPQLNSGKLAENFYRAMERQRATHFEVENPVGKGWFEVHAYPGPYGLRVYMRDVSERKDLEQTLREKVQELDAFTRSVSHDLRGPLSRIGIFSELLASTSTQLPAETRGHIEAIQRAVEQMREMIERLLDLSRATRHKIAMQTVETKRLVDSVLESFASEIEKRSAHVSVGELPVVQADETLLRQVFYNLVSNALKFSRGAQPPTMEIDGAENETEITYRVRDNGVGFPVEKADRMFVAFERLHRPDEFEGSGVGLSIVQQIVNRHGGRVWAESPQSGGAVFYFTLPNNSTQSAS